MNKFAWKELKEHVYYLYNKYQDDIPKSCYDDVLIKMSEIERSYKNKFKNLTEKDWREMAEHLEDLEKRYKYDYEEEI